jgi:hypothetical protein
MERENMQYLPTWSDRFFPRREVAVAPPAAAIPVERVPVERVIAAAVKAEAVAYAREVFSIGAHRVTKDAASGWQCECQGFAPSLECDHVKEAVRLQSVRQAHR